MICGGTGKVRREDSRAPEYTACAQCHGDDGHGRTEAGIAVGAKDLTREEARRMSDAEIEHQIREGKRNMPAFGNLLDAREIAALVAHVRSL